MDKYHGAPQATSRPLAARLHSLSISRSSIGTLVAAALLAACAGSVAAQDCRANFGGTYDFAHVGIKPDGHFFSALASFTIRPNGTFDVIAGINERDVPPYQLAIGGHAWWWVDECDIAIDRPGFIGRVSDDGRFISLATFDAEQLAGVAVRTG